MTLDPGIQFVLDQLGALEEVSPGEISLEEQRRNFDNLSQLGSGQSDGLEKSYDIEIGLVGRTLRARVYVPANRIGRGLGVYFHGGGFVLGSIESHDGTVGQLAVAAKTMMISVDYRLAPENKFPAAALDAIDSIKWIRSKISEFDCDENLIFLLGDSAGGNLAAVSSNYLNSQSDFVICAQALIYPAVYWDETYSLTAFSEGYFLTASQMDFFNRSYLKDETDLKNPLLNAYIDENLRKSPPSLIVTAEYDPLRDGGELYAKALVESGVCVTSHRYLGMIHGFISMAGFAQGGAQALLDIGQYIAGFAQ